METLKTIVEKCDADVTTMDSNGWTALHHACNRSTKEYIKKDPTGKPIMETEGENKGK
jgi:hypothetical protein